MAALVLGAQRYVKIGDGWTTAAYVMSRGDLVMIAVPAATPDGEARPVREVPIAPAGPGRGTAEVRLEAVVRQRLRIEPQGGMPVAVRFDSLQPEAWPTADGLAPLIADESAHPTALLPETRSDGAVSDSVLRDYEDADEGGGVFPASVSDLDPRDGDERERREEMPLTGLNDLAKLMQNQFDCLQRSFNQQLARSQQELRAEFSAAHPSSPGVLSGPSGNGRARPCVGRTETQERTQAASLGNYGQAEPSLLPMEHDGASLDGRGGSLFGQQRDDMQELIRLQRQQLEFQMRQAQRGGPAEPTLFGMDPDGGQGVQSSFGRRSSARAEAPLMQALELSGQPPQRAKAGQPGTRVVVVDASGAGAADLDDDEDGNEATTRLLQRLNLGERSVTWEGLRRQFEQQPDLAWRSFNERAAELLGRRGAPPAGAGWRAEDLLSRIPWARHGTAKRSFLLFSKVHAALAEGDTNKAKGYTAQALRYLEQVARDEGDHELGWTFTFLPDPVAVASPGIETEGITDPECGCASPRQTQAGIKRLKERATHEQRRMDRRGKTKQK